MIRFFGVSQEVITVGLSLYVFGFACVSVDPACSARLALTSASPSPLFLSDSAHYFVSRSPLAEELQLVDDLQHQGHPFLRCTDDDREFWRSRSSKLGADLRASCRVFVVTYGLFFVFHIGCALSQNIETLLVCR